ncbi:MAG: triosephosphate isomerase [Thermoplasmata archaeon]|jgi:triosephosphate isomerase|nr:triosephosphate isomerase [Thermoplasmata archaeon]
MVVFPTGMPVVIVNYKTYAEATGKRAVAFTEALAKAAHGRRVTLAVAPQAADIGRVAQATRVPVLAQHVDSLAPGNGTGATLVEAVADAGAVGSLLNHAERRLTLAEIDAACQRLAKAGLARVVCTDAARTTGAAAALAPDLLAIEPPELIGGSVSVTSADPEIVRQSVRAAKASHPQARVLCGAGVKTGEDLRRALELGAEGVLLASAVMKAKEPAAALAELLSGLP